jgi:hypothetical protein
LWITGRDNVDEKCSSSYKPHAGESLGVIICRWILSENEAESGRALELLPAVDEFSV